MNEFMKKIEIRRFFLGITTHCNMVCRYCFVKDTNEFMSLKDAQRCLDFFLQSGGKNKLLYLYGGEPLLYFDFIKKIVPIFSRQAEKYKKVPSVIIVTNGTIVNEDICKFIKEYHIKVMISLSGRKESHDFFRVFKNGRKTFEIIRKNIELFSRVVSSKDLWVSYTLHPQFLKNFKKDIFYLIHTLHFINLHIEPVQYTSGVYWSPVELEEFEIKVKELFECIKKNITKRKFIFNSNVIRHLEVLLGIAPKDDFLYKIYNNLRVWPNSKMSFSHFAVNFIERYTHLREKFQKEVIKFSPKFTFDHYKNLLKVFNSLKKKTSVPLYFTSGERVWKVYNKLCQKFAEEIFEISWRDKSYKRYFLNAIERAI